MNITAFSAEIVEAWAVWQVLRKLGFSADQIFWEFRLMADDQRVLFVVLHSQNKQFSVKVSEDLTEEAAKALAERAEIFQNAVNDGSLLEEELQEALMASYVWNNKESLLASMKGKGFVFPFQLN